MVDHIPKNKYTLVVDGLLPFTFNEICGIKREETMTIQDDIKELEYLETGFNKNIVYFKLFARTLLYLIKTQQSIKKMLHNHLMSHHKNGEKC